MPTLRLKIFGQDAPEEIFGYKSAVANELYLLYCLNGKIYFTDKIPKHFKYIWIALNFCLISISNAVASGYLWYDAKTDLMMMMNVANFVGATNSIVLGFPLISYLFSDQIEAMIGHVDRIFSSNTDDVDKQQRIMDNVRKTWWLFVGPYPLSGTMFFSICFLDVMLFFEPEKMKNHLYYSLPIPLIDQYGSFGLLCLVNLGISILTTEFLLLEVCTMLTFVLYWNVICCDELNSLCDDLNAGSRDLNNFVIENGRFDKTWNRDFGGTTERCVERFQKIITLINYMRGFVEVTGSFFTITSFFYGLVTFLLCLSDKLPLVLKMKYLLAYLATVVVISFFYRVGQNLDNLIQNVSLAVYSTPWYRSSKVRTDVYVFLCQIQSVKNFAIIKVYGMLLKNFSRYLNAILTYTNVLRKLIHK